MSEDLLKRADAWKDLRDPIHAGHIAPKLIRDLAARVRVLEAELNAFKRNDDMLTNLVGKIGAERDAWEATAQSHYKEAYALRADAKRMDWLEQQGLIGIRHMGLGEYANYAGDLFPALRNVCDREMGK